MAGMYRHDSGTGLPKVLALSASRAAMMLARRDFGDEGFVESFSPVAFRWDANKWCRGVGDIGGKAWEAVIARKLVGYGEPRVVCRKTVRIVRTLSGGSDEMPEARGRFSGGIAGDLLSTACAARPAPKFRSVASFTMDIALQRQVSV